MKVPPVEKETETEDSDVESKADDSEEVLVEDEKEDEEAAEKKTFTVLNDKWVQLNAQAPIWMRYDCCFYLNGVELIESQ